MKRTLEDKIIEDLKDSKLWKNKIKQDCKDHKVFLAIRNGYIDFYYKGGRLFKFDKNGFQTHIKYAAVIPKSGDDYITDKKSFVSDFESHYERIKENCANYSGLEASGVSSLYHKYSYLSKNPIVVLDIEVSFKALNLDKKLDRIDLLLYNKETKTLRFVEAKHYTNKEIISRTAPKVINQIESYNSQIKKSKKVIINEITSYINSINLLFDINLPAPEKIDPEVSLFIFGFDNDQKNGRLKEIENQLSEINFYSIGNVENLKISSLYK